MRLTLVITLVSACAALGACGGTDSTTANKPKLSADTAKVRFAQCMRKAGIDFPDPGSGGSASVSIPDSISPQRSEEIQARCSKSSGLAKADPPPTPVQSSANVDRALHYASCMRGHSIDMPDPAVSRGVVVINYASVNTKSPRFAAAAHACGKP